MYTGKTNDGRSTEEKKEQKKKQLQKEKARIEADDSHRALLSAIGGPSNKRRKTAAAPAAVAAQGPSMAAGPSSTQKGGKRGPQGAQKGGPVRRGPVSATPAQITDRDISIVLEGHHHITKSALGFRFASFHFHNTY